MRFHSVLLIGALCAGILFPGTCPMAMADSGLAPDSSSAPAEVRPAVAAQAGTGAEALEYEQREQASPEVQEFKGGETVLIGGGFLLLVVIIILIVVLLGD